MQPSPGKIRYLYIKKKGDVKYFYPQGAAGHSYTVPSSLVSYKDMPCGASRSMKKLVSRQVILRLDRRIQLFIVWILRSSRRMILGDGGPCSVMATYDIRTRRSVSL